MTTAIIILVIIGIIVLIILIWGSPNSPSALGDRQPRQDTEIDMSNSRHIGLLIGMMGGSIEDAAIARFALKRFEEQHGRKPTFREAGLVIGLMRSLK